MMKSKRQHRIPLARLEIFTAMLHPTESAWSSQTFVSYHITIWCQICASWGWSQHGPPKQWYPTTLLYGVRYYTL